MEGAFAKLSKPSALSLWRSFIYSKLAALLCTCKVQVPALSSLKAKDSQAESPSSNKARGHLLWVKKMENSTGPNLGTNSEQKDGDTSTLNTWWQLKPREAEGKVTEVRLGSASEGIQVTKKMIGSKARTCTRLRGESSVLGLMADRVDKDTL